ncbi:MAG TPA: hypothetical protein VNG12_11885 [Acidimicrobiales bacterium]|nr:hypothetical protein [Acidimicrobiales bacterium]
MAQEYKVLTNPIGFDLERDLNKAAEDGWQFVAVISPAGSPGGGGGSLLLSRVKKKSPAVVAPNRLAEVNPTRPSPWPE